MYRALTIIAAILYILGIVVIIIPVTTIIHPGTTNNLGITIVLWHLVICLLVCRSRCPKPDIKKTIYII